MGVPANKIAYSLRRKIAILAAIVIIVIVGLWSFTLYPNSSSSKNSYYHYRYDPNTAIHILADGNISFVGSDPTSIPITRNGTTYTIVGSLQTEIIIEKNSIVLDGKGLPSGSLETNGNYPNQNAITLFGVNNVTVENVNVDPMYYSIWFNDASNSKVMNTSSFYITLTGGQNNVVTNCAVTRCDLQDSSSSTVSDCVVGEFNLEQNSNNNSFLRKQLYLVGPKPHNAC